MNAFLIFCKRHRSSVRSGFPHLENRAVTRVLGEWWATLNPEQKLCYTNLAQEVKEKLFVNFLKSNLLMIKKCFFLNLVQGRIFERKSGFQMVQVTCATPSNPEHKTEQQKVATKC